MDVLVMLEELSEHSTVLAHVNSVPSPLNSERPTREVVTLYGEATSESLAMALAARRSMVKIRYIGDSGRTSRTMARTSGSRLSARADLMT